MSHQVPMWRPGMVSAPKPDLKSEGFIDSGLLSTALLYAILLIAGFYAGVLYEGRSVAIAAKAELQDLQQRAARTSAWLRDEKAQLEKDLRRELSQLRTQLNQDQGQANETHHTLVAGLRAGTVGVRVPVVPASCTSHGLQPAGVSGTGAATAHAQLDPAAAADLAAIPHDGDASIRELNFCIAQYNQVKTAYDKWRAVLQEAEHAQTP